MFNKKGLFVLIGVLITLVAIPITIYLAKQQQEIRKKAATSFGIGFNVSGITHYGYPDLFPYSSFSQVDSTFTEIQKMKATVIRIFAANNQIADIEAARRLDEFLKKAASLNISVIISLIDFYNSGFSPQGVNYTRCDFSPCLLGNDFFSGGYNGRYKDFVKTIVEANKHHSNIYAWEVGNELKLESNAQVFISFMNDMSSFIKNLDPGHPVATGMLTAGHTGLSPDAFYSQLTNIDIITIHQYNGDRSGLQDVLWANANNKRVLVEEFGLSGTSDRSVKIKDELNYWREQRVSAVLQWGFIAKDLPDNGNGDRDLGMDTIWHTDYDSLSTLFQSFNSGGVCIQVLTPARNSQTGECKDFPTPCDVPTGWEKVDGCSSPSFGKAAKTDGGGYLILNLDDGGNKTVCSLNTLETWFKIDINQIQSIDIPLISKGTDSSGLQLNLTADGKLIFFMAGVKLVSDIPPKLGDWNHVAVVIDIPPAGSMSPKRGGIYLYLNGKLGASLPVDQPISRELCEKAAPFKVGLPEKIGITVSIDEPRLSYSPRYTTDFPLPTSPFLNDESTILLWHLDGDVKDSSSNKFDGQAIGDVQFIESTVAKNPTPTCQPRPACLDAEPRCLIPEPADGWCPISTVIPTQKLVPTAPNVTQQQLQQFKTDVNSDNKLDVLDYNSIVSCFKEKANTSSCANKAAADLNKDGVIDTQDLNMFIFYFQKGQSK